MRKSQNIAIAGIVGVPGCYGGFETLAENLLDFHHRQNLPEQMVVYCSSKAYEAPRLETFKGAELRYIALSANGVASIPYDILTLFDAARRGTDKILLLGVSGAIAIPLLRLFSKCEITTNIDGIEWKRAKWRGIAKAFLKFSEKVAVRYSHKVIADNQAIADYVAEEYGAQCDVIAYGGDHAKLAQADTSVSDQLPAQYALSLCRIEPENNVNMILRSWKDDGLPLVFVGNWDNSDFGRTLKAEFKDHPNIHLVDPVYDAAQLRGIRDQATVYIHGHSAGGTNPSLVEMMHFTIPVLAFDCSYNRHSTQGQAAYFKDIDSLQTALTAVSDGQCIGMGERMRATAEDLYVWDKIGQKYFELLRR
jgi:glycosyltransferase involved in cell wall biosynthesis